MLNWFKFRSRLIGALMAQEAYITRIEDELKQTEELCRQISRRNRTLRDNVEYLTEALGLKINQEDYQYGDGC